MYRGQRYPEILLHQQEHAVRLGKRAFSNVRIHTQVHTPLMSDPNV
jgi:hypothetical protein